MTNCKIEFSKQDESIEGPKASFRPSCKRTTKGSKNKAIFKDDTQYKCLQNKYNKNAICSSLDTCLHNQYNENATCSLLDTCLHKPVQ